MARLIYGIIGHPVHHSLSPAMQNAAFSALGIEAEYRLFDVAPEGLDDFLGNIIKEDIRGLNVTIPHKITAKRYIEHNGTLDENARRLGAINTIKADGDKLRGYNTDGPGFYRSLVEDLSFEPEGRNVCILGAGGAATAVVMYLGNGPKSIRVIDIDSGKCKDLKGHYAKYYDEKRLKVISREELRDAMQDTDLLINATPIGMKEGDPSPIDKDLLHSGLRVYDLVYNQTMTRLARDSKEKKAHATAGLGMLLYQGAIAFEIWTGQKAPIGVMKRALREAVKGQGARGKGQG